MTTFTYTAIDAEHLRNLLREASKSLPASGLRDRIEAVENPENAACVECGHLLWNHNADGPCAVREGYEDACRCQDGNGPGLTLRWARAALRSLRAGVNHPTLPFMVYAVLLALVALSR
jgi:hypothetical protein